MRPALGKRPTPLGGTVVHLCGLCGYVEEHHLRITQTARYGSLSFPPRATKRGLTDGPHVD